jgi:hypothetical protein
VRLSRAKGNDAARSEVGSCAVYEIDGRLLVRTVDMSDGLGIERDDTFSMDGFPDVDARIVGDHGELGCVCGK